MGDLISIGLIMLLFVLSWGFVRLCETLEGKSS